MAKKKSIVPADDGGMANEVGAWAKEKHQILRNYVGATSAVRRKFTHGISGTGTYIDLYCAMGRSRIRDTDEFIDGSPVAAWKESNSRSVPFSDIYIADIDPEAVEQCTLRLEKADANPVTRVGPAAETVSEICGLLDPYGYHFAFIDPYNLASLPFSVIKKLSEFKRMDLLIHVASHDLQRNLDHFINKKQDGLDDFAPGWKDAISKDGKASTQRTEVFNHWRGLIAAEGKMTASGIEHFTGGRNQTLYWLVLAAGDMKAEELWDKVRRLDPQRALFD